MNLKEENEAMTEVPKDMILVNQEDDKIPQA